MMATKKPVTVWLRFDTKKQKWKHNHIEDGHVYPAKPIAKSDNQLDQWKNARWKKEYRHMIDGVVT